MSNFKVGDKVRVASTNSLFIGTVGQIVEVYGRTVILESAHFVRGYYLNFPEEWLELDSTSVLDKDLEGVVL